MAHPVYYTGGEEGATPSTPALLETTSGQRLAETAAQRSVNVPGIFQAGAGFRPMTGSGGPAGTTPWSTFPIAHRPVPENPQQTLPTQHMGWAGPLPSPVPAAPVPSPFQVQGARHAPGPQSAMDFGSSFAAQRDRELENRLSQQLEPVEFQRWKAEKDQVFRPLDNPDVSVKMRRQLRWRQWAVSLIYAIAQAYEPGLVRAFALLETSPPLEATILMDLVDKYRLHNLVRFKRDQVVHLLAGDSAPP